MKKQIVIATVLGIILGGGVAVLAGMMAFVWQTGHPFGTSLCLFGMALLALGLLFLFRGGTKRLSDKLGTPYTEAARLVYSSQSPYQKEIKVSESGEKLQKQPIFSLPALGILLTVAGVLNFLVFVVYKIAY